VTRDRLKVAFVINSLGAGGAERSLRELLPRLLEAGIDSEVICFLTRDEGVQDQVVGEGVPVRLLAGGSPIRWVVDLRRYLRSSRPDVVHTTLFEADIVGRLACWRLPCKVMTSLVNISYDNDRLWDPRVSRTKLRVVQLIDAVTARHLCDHFHAITDAVASASVRHLGVSPGRITVIPRGRDAARLGTPSPARRREARQRLGLSASTPVLINVGRQEFQKGQADLLHAMALLGETHPSVVLIQVGRRGNQSDYLECLVRELGLRERIRFLGHRDDVPDLLAAADVFVFPSIYEGLGGALIEAMALELPIVTTDIPAVREVVERGGNALVVPPGSPAELAKALRAMLDDDGMRDSFGRRSRALYEAKFTLDRSAQAMIDMYREVAAGTQGASPALESLAPRARPTMRNTSRWSSFAVRPSGRR
jgi:glycosyltransferase involved in cell wall biosynthesis